MTPEEIVQLFFEGVFNKGDLNLCDQLISPAYTYNGSLGGPEATKEWAQSLRQLFPDLDFTINDLIGAGNKVAIRWTLTGTDSKSNPPKRLTGSGTNIIEIVNGRAISNWQNGGTPADMKPIQ
jgi:predicted ester cyclase